MLGIEVHTLTMSRLHVGDHVISVFDQDVWTVVRSEIVSNQASTDEWLPEARHYVFANGVAKNLMPHATCHALLDYTARREHVMG